MAPDLQPMLDALAAEGLLRTPHRLEPVDATRVRVDGKTVVLFCSNDYLALSHSEALARHAAAAFREHGVGSGASRLISGTRGPHLEAERELASWVDAEAGLLFSSGYAANLGALTSLLGPSDVAFSDRLNHASLIDGLRLSRAQVHVYDHGDPDHLRALLAEHRGAGRHAWIVTDAVFSMDGDEAPLPELRSLADEFESGLFVDEAHALGVIGEGRGLAHDRGVRADAVVGTLGKAVGVAGAFVAGSAALRTLMENRARSYVFSTAIPAALAEVIRHGARLARQAHAERERLGRHSAHLRSALGALGWRVPAGRSPIVPIRVDDRAEVMRHSAALLEAGFFVQGIRPPTVPVGTSRLRVVPTAAHDDAQIAALIAAFEALR